MHRSVVPWVSLLGVAAALATAGGCANLWADRPKPPTRLVAGSWSGDPAIQEKLNELSAAGRADVAIRLVLSGEGPAWECDAIPTSETAYGRAFSSGTLHLCIADSPDVASPGSAAWRWLLEDLSLTRKAWKVVFLPKACFATAPLRMEEEFAELATLLAREEVVLAFAPSERDYVRTARIGESGAKATQFILLPATDGPVAASSPAWVSRILPGPCIGTLDADPWRLRWNVAGPDGTIHDSVDIHPNGAGGYAVRIYSVNEMLASQQEEPGSENDETQTP